MTDLWLIALGFGVLPFLAVLLQFASGILKEHEALVWGALAGVLGFLGIAHAGASLLENNSLLRIAATPALSGLVAALGLLAGIWLGWLFLGRRSGGTETGLTKVVWAAAMYVLLHSLADGLLLGQAYAGPFPIGFPLDVATVSGTVIHRFAEGALVVVPALYAAWRPPKTYLPLAAALVAIPAAFVPTVVLGAGTPSSGAIALVLALSVLSAGLEAGFAIMFLLLAVIPRAIRSQDSRWAVTAALAFTVMLLIHLLVE